MGTVEFPSSSFGNWGALQSFLEDKLPVKVSSATGTSASETSSSFQTLLSVNVDREADEAILLLGMASLSHDTTGGTIALELSVPSLSSEDYYYRETSGGTGGQNGARTLFMIVQPSSASTIACTLSWKRAASGTAIYSAEHKLIVLQFKER